MSTKPHSGRHRHTVYEMVDRIRARPPMYLGGSCIHSLQNLIAGMHWAGAEDGGNPLADFTAWHLHVSGRSTSDPWGEIEAELGEREALELFLSSLDRFRRCSRVELEHSVGPFVLPASVTSTHIPNRLTILRYEPSPGVAMHSPREPRAPEFAADFFDSVDSAKSYALRHWGVPIHSWNPTI